MIQDKLITDFMQSTIAAVAPNPQVFSIALGLTLAWTDTYNKFWNTAAAMMRSTAPPAPPKN